MVGVLVNISDQCLADITFSTESGRRMLSTWLRKVPGFSRFFIQDPPS